MARKPNTKTQEQTTMHVANVQPASLADIVAFGPEGGRINVDALDELLSAGHVETDGNDPDQNGMVLVRATDAGLAHHNNVEAVKSPVSASQIIERASAPAAFAIASFAIPEEGRKRARRSETYPFDGLAVGQAFFVPATAERPEPVKSMNSTVSSANARYVEKTGNRVVVERKVFARGEDGKIALDDAGKRVIAEVISEEVDETRPVRVFGVTEVPDGAAAGFGEQYAGVSGAAVYRSK